MAIRVHPVRTGTVHVRPGQVTGHGPLRRLRPLLDRDWAPPMPILAWAIEHPVGVILVDTGEVAAASGKGHFPAWHPYYRRSVRFDVTPEEEIVPALAALGIAPGDIRHVVMTHLHTDHAAGLPALAGRHVMASAPELRLATGPGHTVNGYVVRFPDGMVPQPIAFAGDPVGPFERSLPLTGDGAVTVLPTPGHTAGHVSVLVRPGEGPAILLAGDTSYSQATLLDGVVDGVAPKARVVRETNDRIRALARDEPLVYLPSHDPDGPRRLAAREPLPTGAP